MSLQPVMTFDFYNSTVTWCPDPALNLSWVTNATAVPELEDWSTPSSSNRRRHHPHLLMVWWQQLVWSALFALMLLVATGGNAIVLWIVLGELPSAVLSPPLSSFSSVILHFFVFLCSLQASTRTFLSCSLYARFTAMHVNLLQFLFPCPRTK